MARAQTESKIEKIHRIGELIDGIEFAMMTTVDHEGQLRSRPMATQKVGFDGDLWFFTRLDSPKIFEIKKDQHVNLSYARPEKHVYVSISGRGEVVRNAAKHQQLWRPALRAWFPEGLSDPQLCLIRVRVDKAESWEFGAGRLVHAIGLVRALAGRKPFVPSGAQNQKIDLTRAA